MLGRGLGGGWGFWGGFAAAAAPPQAGEAGGLLLRHRDDVTPRPPGWTMRGSWGGGQIRSRTAPVPVLRPRPRQQHPGQRAEVTSRGGLSRDASCDYVTGASHPSQGRKMTSQAAIHIGFIGGKGGGACGTPLNGQRQSGDHVLLKGATPRQGPPPALKRQRPPGAALKAATPRQDPNCLKGAMPVGPTASLKGQRRPRSSAPAGGRSLRGARPRPPGEAPPLRGVPGGSLVPS